MAQEKRGMDAVIAKAGKAGSPRKAMMQRKGKGPGMAIMIAIGKPKGMMGEKTSMEEKPSLREELDASKGEGLSKSQKIAALEEKIGYLKAELALLKNESDEMDAEDSPEEDSEEDDEENY
jgi:hypothetical protein